MLQTFYSRYLNMSCSYNKLPNFQLANLSGTTCIWCQSVAKSTAGYCKSPQIITSNFKILMGSCFDFVSVMFVVPFKLVTELFLHNFTPPQTLTFSHIDINTLSVKPERTEVGLWCVSMWEAEFMNKNELKITRQDEASVRSTAHERQQKPGTPNMTQKNKAQGKADKQNEPTRTRGDRDYLKTSAGEHSWGQSRAGRNNETQVIDMMGGTRGTRRRQDFKITPEKQGMTLSTNCNRIFAAKNGHLEAFKICVK